MRRLLIWLVVLALVGGGGYAADAMVRDQAQQRAAAAIDAQLDATATTVSLGGWPFSLALLTRKVPNAVVTADTATLPVADQQVALRDLTLTTGEVSLTTDQLRADRVTGAAKLAYAELEKLAGVPVSFGEGGRLALRYQVDVFGRTVTLGVSAKPVLDPGAAAIQLTEPKAELDGNQVDLPIQQNQIDALVKPIGVGLDYGLRVTAITPAADGLSIAVAGDQVSLPLG